MTGRSLRADTLPRESNGRGDASGPARLPYVRLVYGPGAHDGLGPVVVVTADRPLVVGRDPGPGELALGDDAWASRRHTRIARDPADPTTLVVEDLGSRNGTWIDGQRTTTPTRVEAGQLVRVGASLLVVGLGPASGPLTRPEPDAARAGFIALAPASAALWERLATIAASDEPALLVGEIGSGKTLVARLLHDRSPRAAGAFVPHNASAIPLHLEEATLFGVVKGFIPGVNAQRGLFAQAAGGTLFLDELADLTAPAQAKLLDALDPREPSYLPVGGDRRQPTRCRLVAAVQHDLFELVEDGRVRHDLASRIAVARLDVPPLRLRRDDVLVLFAGALARYTRGRTLADVATEVEIAEALVLASWTENVRGLESLARRVGLGETLSVDIVRAHAERGGQRRAPPAVPIGSPPPAPTAPQRAHSPPLWPPPPGELLRRLAATDFHVTPVAEQYGRTRETLGRLLTRLFGPGGRPTVQRAFRVLEASGRAPDAEALDAVYTLFIERAATPAIEEARRRWIDDGTWR